PIVIGAAVLLLCLGSFVATQLMEDDTQQPQVTATTPTPTPTPTAPVTSPAPAAQPNSDAPDEQRARQPEPAIASSEQEVQPLAVVTPPAPSVTSSAVPASTDRPQLQSAEAPGAEAPGAAPLSAPEPLLTKAPQTPGTTEPSKAPETATATATETETARRQQPTTTAQSFNALIERGEALLDAERYRAAAKIFKAALQRRPANQRALSGLGRALVEDNTKEAVSYLKQALKLDPSDALAWHDLGVAYQISTPEQPKEALRAYEQFLKYAPSSKKPSAREIRGIVNKLRGQLNQLD
ncbi:MAG: tetratricopeptide repeat protein, partial [Myxococcales bacterium]|nr:tetratricopeptide repeat protein [Myxococcales bacterium]